MDQSTIEQTIREIHETKKERDELRKQVDHLNQALQIASGDITSLKEQVAKRLAERDHYMRQVAEAMASLNSINSIAEPWSLSAQWRAAVEKPDDGSAARIIKKLEGLTRGSDGVVQPK